MGPRSLGSWLTGWLLVLSLAASPVAPPQAAAQDPSDQEAADAESQAREAFSRGRVHYDNGEFSQAADAFEQAYRLSGRDVLLYNLYLARRDANQLVQAAEALRGYLEKVEVIENRPQLEARLRALDAGIAERKAAEEKKAQETNTPSEGEPNQPQTPAEQAAAQSDERWWITPVAVAGVGALMAVGSIGTGIMAASKHKEIEDKCPSGKNCDASLQATADQGKILSITTDVLLFGGLAVVGTGALLFILKRPKSAKEPTETASRGVTPNVGCSAAGCEGSLSFAF